MSKFFLSFQTKRQKEIPIHTLCIRFWSNASHVLSICIQCIAFVCSSFVVFIYFFLSSSSSLFNCVVYYVTQIEQANKYIIVFRMVVSMPSFCYLYTVFNAIHCNKKILVSIITHRNQHTRTLPASESN